MKINENQKVTLTIGQLKRLVREGRFSSFPRTAQDITDRRTANLRKEAAAKLKQFNALDEDICEAGELANVNFFDETAPFYKLFFGTPGGNDDSFNRKIIGFCSDGFTEFEGGVGFYVDPYYSQGDITEIGFALSEEETEANGQMYYGNFLYDFKDKTFELRGEIIDSEDSNKTIDNELPPAVNANEFINLILKYPCLLKLLDAFYQRTVDMLDDLESQMKEMDGQLNEGRFAKYLK